MRTNTIVMFGLALVFGAAAVFMSQHYLDRQAERRLKSMETQSPTLADTTTVVVAAGQLRFGGEISQSSLKEIAWPAGSVPPGSFRRIDELFAAPGKRVAMATIEPNEPILVSKVSGPGQRATLSAVIEEGMKAVTVRVDDVNGVAGFVLPGDRVDVLLTRRQGEGDVITQVLVEQARVLAVDQSFDQKADKPAVPRAVTLEVETGAAQKVAFASSAGTISLVLRRAGEFEAASNASKPIRQATVSVDRGGQKRQDYAVRSEILR